MDFSHTLPLALRKRLLRKPRRIEPMPGGPTLSLHDLLMIRLGMAEHDQRIEKRLRGKR